MNPTTIEFRTVRLTRRELQVLRLAAAGLKSREVAEELVISKRTVDHHLGEAYRKLEVGNRIEACRAAIRLGFVSHPVEFASRG